MWKKQIGILLNRDAMHQPRETIGIELFKIFVWLKTAYNVQQWKRKTQINRKWQSMTQWWDWCRKQKKNRLILFIAFFLKFFLKDFSHNLRQTLSFRYQQYQLSVYADNPSFRHHHSIEVSCDYVSLFIISICYNFHHYKSVCS